MSYDDPGLVLHEMTDAAGHRFLLLEGAEPDVQWERFIAAVTGLVERAGRPGDGRRARHPDGRPAHPADLGHRARQPARADRRARAVDRHRAGAGQRHQPAGVAARRRPAGTRWASPCTCRTTWPRPSTRRPPPPCSTTWPRPPTWCCRPPRCTRPPSGPGPSWTSRWPPRRRWPAVVTALEQQYDAYLATRGERVRRRRPAGRPARLPDRRRAGRRAGALPRRPVQGRRPAGGLRPGRVGPATVGRARTPGRERLTARGRSKRLQLGPGAAAARRPGGPGGPLTIVVGRRPGQTRFSPRQSTAAASRSSAVCSSDEDDLVSAWRLGVGRLDVVGPGHPAGDHHPAEGAGPLQGHRQVAGEDAVQHGVQQRPQRLGGRRLGDPGDHVRDRGGGPAGRRSRRRPRRRPAGPTRAARTAARARRAATGAGAGPTGRRWCPGRPRRPARPAGPGPPRRSVARPDSTSRLAVACAASASAAGSGAPPNVSRATFPSRAGRRGRRSSTRRSCHPSSRRDVVP